MLVIGIDPLTLLVCDAAVFQTAFLGMPLGNYSFKEKILSNGID